jgi:hypothetical protein
VRSAADIEAVQALLSVGATPADIARLTGVPRSTVRDWAIGRIPGTSPVLNPSCDVHRFSELDEPAYAYLLGMYLGDGCITEYRRWVRLRITLDTKYPNIIRECADAIVAVAPGRPPMSIPKRGCVELCKNWRHWPCLFPQHGPGRKHLRPIALEPWQEQITARQPEFFLRGLVHSDGCRAIATERKGRYVRRAARYIFKNASDDIRALFCAACDAVEVRYTHSPTRARSRCIEKSQCESSMSSSGRRAERLSR